jgi:hypothetical protein
LGTSEAADTHQKMPISLAGATTGDVSSSEQDGKLPAMVIEKAKKQSGGLGVSEEAGESLGGGGLTGKETGDKIGGLGSPLEVGLTPTMLIGNSGMLTGGLDASETVGIP